MADETEALHLRPTGDLALTRPEDVLRFCETVRFSGTLAFQSGTHRGVLPMLNGVPEIAPGQPRLERALDDFLVLAGGSYTLTQMLPALEGATPDGELGLRGSLQTNHVAELLRYCEAAGVSGNLTLRHGDRTCVARYDRGELNSLTVEGGDEDEADLARVLAWADGAFTLRARSVFERRGRKMSQPAMGFLKTLEVALTEVLEKSAKGVEQTHGPRSVAPLSSPSILRGSTLPFGLEEGEGARPAERPSSTVPPVRRTAPPPPNQDSTVKIYFVDRGPGTRSSSTQHVAARLGSEVVQLDPSASKGLPAVRDASAVLASVAKVPAAPAPAAPKPAAPKPAAPAPAAPKPAAQAPAAQAPSAPKHTEPAAPVTSLPSGAPRTNAGSAPPRVEPEAPPIAESDQLAPAGSLALQGARSSAEEVARLEAAIAAVTTTAPASTPVTTVRAATGGAPHPSAVTAFTPSAAPATAARATPATPARSTREADVSPEVPAPSRPNAPAVPASSTREAPAPRASHALTVGFAVVLVIAAGVGAYALMGLLR